ncbi:HNH endonuclease signature motif containing protein [Arsenophonus sp. aPb]|uniref:HNH endonuclease n=1 Tax=Arsenophonus sp. aPb TaxID=3041619 RepID=UPI0024698F3F|nr:HNH endonuclease signature motif containing protein [Arsenophonus sp. aPb]WGL97348.1 HNH endonuclease signature motif containing protein [Arsenophonus sp. aPb]
MSVRRSIPSNTKLRLFSESGGHCQHPRCLKPLFPVDMGGDRHIAEMAHVIPHGETGPRHEQRPSEEFEADSFENLILLCPTCHTIIDKAPDSYPRSMLLDWKRNHLITLVHSQGIICYEERKQARYAVIAAMGENKAIWKEFAPCDGANFEFDPESETANAWSQRMRSVILPNHYRIQAIISKNQCHLTVEEQEIFAQYQEHVRGLTERHVCCVSGIAIRYPQDMDGIFA